MADNPPRWPGDAGRSGNFDFFDLIPGDILAVDQHFASVRVEVGLHETRLGGRQILDAGANFETLEVHFLSLCGASDYSRATIWILMMVGWLAVPSGR